MGTTARGFRFPEASDAPDGPTQIHNLAADVQDELDGTLAVGALTATGAVTGANVTATATVQGADLAATDDLTVGDDATIAGDLAVAGALTVGGVSVPANTRGKSIIATSESRTNVAYGTLTTPDQVTGIVLPTDGLLVIAYHATVKESVLNAGRAALFIGATQLRGAVSGVAATSNLESGPIRDTGSSASVNIDYPLPSLTHPNSIPPGTPYSGDVTTGQVVGTVPATGLPQQPILVFAAAGTYTISVQYSATSGSVTAKNRKLWVEARAF